jgi:hypothetical protein
MVSEYLFVKEENTCMGQVLLAGVEGRGGWMGEVVVVVQLWPKESRCGCHCLAPAATSDALGRDKTRSNHVISTPPFHAATSSFLLLQEQAREQRTSSALIRSLHFPQLKSVRLGKYSFAYPWQIDWVTCHTSLQILRLNDCSIVHSLLMDNELQKYVLEDGLFEFGEIVDRVETLAIQVSVSISLVLGRRLISFHQRAPHSARLPHEFRPVAGLSNLAVR